MKDQTAFREELKRAERMLARRDPAMRLLIRKYGQCGISPHTRYFETLVESVISQQLSTKAAATIYRRFKELYAPARFPRPAQIAATPDEQLRGVGISMQKVSYIKDLATKAEDGALKLSRLSRLPDQEAIDMLTQVKGIGVWTAHMFLIFSLGRLDILPVGDLGIRKAIQLTYGLQAMPEAPEMERLAVERGWAPYRSVASWYLWCRLDNK